VSKHFYGDANKYQKIAQANNIADANKIQAGQTITIPA
jgi:nucleoid-associated protein YgaU